MDPLPIIIPASLLGFMLVLLYLYIEDREPFLGIWAGAMGLWAVPYILLVVYGLHIAGIRAAVVEIALFIAAMMNLWGTYLFMDWKTPGLWFPSSCLVLLWYLVGASLGWSVLAQAPAYFFLGACYIIAGVRALTRPVMGVHRWSIGMILIFWGFHQWDYPFLGRTSVSPWGHVLALGLGVGAFLSLMMAYASQRQRHKLIPPIGVVNPGCLQKEFLRLQTPLSLILVGIDNLRWVNEPLGDRLLAEVANTLTQFCREGEFVARWSEDQVVLVLPEVDEATASERCQQVREAFEILVPGCLAMGWATGSDPVEVLRLAEERMSGDLQLRVHPPGVAPSSSLW